MLMQPLLDSRMGNLVAGATSTLALQPLTAITKGNWNIEDLLQSCETEVSHPLGIAPLTNQGNLTER